MPKKAHVCQSSQGCAGATQSHWKTRHKGRRRLLGGDRQGNLPPSRWTACQEPSRICNEAPQACKTIGHWPAPPLQQPCLLRQGRGTSNRLKARPRGACQAARQGQTASGQRREHQSPFGLTRQILCFVCLGACALARLPKPQGTMAFVQRLVVVPRRQSQDHASGGGGEQGLFLVPHQDHCIVWAKPIHSSCAAWPGIVLAARHSALRQVMGEASPQPSQVLFRWPRY